MSKHGKPCMTELLTTKYREEFSSDVLMERENGTTSGYQPFTIPFLVYRILRKEQRILKDRDKGLLDNSSRRWIWKPFQNYKIWSAKPYPYSVTYYDQLRGYPPVNHYINVDPLPSAYSGYWYWTTLAGGPFEPFGEAGRLNATTTINGAIACPPFYVPSEHGFVAKPEDIGVLNNRALGAMLPNIKQELSYLNSLYELKDFAPLVESAVRLARNRSLARYVLSYLKAATYKDKGILKRTLRSLALTGNANFLTWKFAVAPLISDVKAVHALSKAYHKRINALVNQTGGLRKRHFTVAFEEFVNTDEQGPVGFIQPFAGFNACIDYQARRRIYYEPTTFHAEIQYNYNYTGYQKQHAALLGALDSLGVNFNPRIIWDALPFSFVVDWLINTGELLDTLKIGFMEPQINVHQYLYSVKRKRKIWVDVGVKPDSTTLVPGPDKRRVYLPVVNEEVYGRFTDYPLTASQLMASGLNSNEFTLGASLITALSSKRGRAR